VHRNLRSMLAVLATLLTAELAIGAGAGAPARGLPYSGRLELDGAPISSVVPMKFDLFDDATAGTLLFTQSQDVQVVGGAFAVILGTVGGNPLPPEAYTSAELFIAVTVNGVALEDRKQIFAATQSVRGAQADNFTVTQNLTVTGTATVATLNASAVHVGDLKLDPAAGGGSHIAAGNVNGNMHIDADNPSTGEGALYLNYYSGKGVKIGDGANGIVAQVNTAGDITTNGTVFAGLHMHTCPAVAYDVQDCACPAGYKVLGGGAACQIGYLHESRPINDTTWRVRCGFGESHEWPKNVINMTLMCARIGN
jgi:hypothetical protein